MQFSIDINSKHQELFQQARELLLDYGFNETKKPRITTYSDANGGICHMRTTKTGIDIGLLKGARMQDKLALLVGQGKVMRVLPLTSINQNQIKYYLDQAIAINSGT